MRLPRSLHGPYCVQFNSTRSFTSVLICPRGQAASLVRHVLFNDALFYTGAPMVIDVARLRVIRQSDPVCLFVCLFPLSTRHSTVQKTTGSNGTA